MELDWTNVYKREGYGTYGTLGIKIDLSANGIKNFDCERIRRAVYACEKLLENAIMAEVFAHDPEAQERSKEQRKNLLGCFEEPIYVEEIPNGYCPNGCGCCEHLPWFIVTTKIGRIKIGWRKSVINIDWKDTQQKKNGSELFPDERTTVGDTNVHAWSYEKAREYVNAIITGEPITRPKKENVTPVSA